MVNETKVFGCIAVLVASLFVGSCVTAFTGVYSGYSVGTREGVLVKSSYKGFIFKSYESAIVMNATPTQGQSSAPGMAWEFSTLDKKMGDRLLALIGKPVRIEYNEWLVAPWLLQGTGYTVNKIEEVK